jgi:putative PIN family toxin of toxin-antitoxin system
VVTSTLVLAELRRVIGQPKFAWLREQRQDAVLRLMQLLWRQALLVDDAEDVAPLERDPSDTKFLALAKATGAHAIVSGDAHLLDLDSYEGIPVRTPAQFLAMLEEARGKP